MDSDCQAHKLNLDVPGNLGKEEGADAVRLSSQDGNRTAFAPSDVVEARGVEPLSENALTATSPGADGYLDSLASARAVTLRGLVASLCMARSKLCALTFTTNRRPIPSRGTPGWNAR